MKPQFSKYIAISGILLIISFFLISFIRGNVLLKRSEKEFNIKNQSGEAEARKYLLQEIDAKTGMLRWELTALQGTTQNKLNSALIKNINAKVYKDNQVIFELYAPYGKANAKRKEVYLFGGVTTKNPVGDFLLNSNKLGLGNGTSIEAKKGFNLSLKGKGDLTGESAVINDTQRKIIIKDLKKASFKDIVLSGKKVTILRNENGEITNAKIVGGGEIIMKDKDNSSLKASNIKWSKDNIIQATEKVIYNSKDITFHAGYLTLTKDGKITAKNNVQINHGSTKCFGNILTYENTSLILIKGNPRAIQDGKEISADEIMYNLDTGKVSALGNVKTTISSKA